MTRHVVRDLSAFPIPSSSSPDLRVEPFPQSGEFLSSLPIQYSKISERVIAPGFAAVYLGATYIFVPTLLKWLHSRTEEATRYLANTLELESVSVNYRLAVSPFLTFIDQRARNIPALRYPSVCIGCWRLGMTVVKNLNVNEDSLGEHEIKVRGVTKVALTVIDGFGFSGRASTFCLSPVDSSIFPVMIRWKKDDYIEGFFRNVFSEADLRCLMWNIGNALIDPVVDPRILYLYGAGGEGKTTTIGILYNVLRGTIGSFSRDYVGTNVEMKDDDKLAAMSNRVMVFGDTLIKDSKINEVFWKLVTGKDVITVHGTTGTMRCVCVFAGNNLWYGNSSKHHKWFIRRTLVFKLDAPPKDSIPPPETFDDEDRIKFISRCLYLRVTRSHPIISLSSVFLAIFGYRVAVATRGIEICPNANELECLSATHAIVISSMIKYEKLIELFKSVSASTVGSISEGAEYIKGIRPKFHGLG